MSHGMWVVSHIKNHTRLSRQDLETSSKINQGKTLTDRMSRHG